YSCAYLGSSSKVATINNTAYAYHGTKESLCSINQNGEGKIIGNYPDAKIIYKNGFFYVLDYSDGVKLNKLDADGNLLASMQMWDRFNPDSPYYVVLAILDDDSLLISKNQSYDEYAPLDTLYILSPNLSDKTEIQLPTAQVEVEHGLMKDIAVTSASFGRCISYQNKVYANLQDGIDYFGYLDMNTMEWHTFEYPNDIAYFDSFGISHYSVVGKYILFEDAVYDMEKDEFLDVSGYSLYQYYGGDCHISNGGRFIKFPCGADGKEEITEHENISDTIYPINSEQYAVMDEYGIFLHTYEGGDNDEQTALLFENN
ncbi:MAG: hypothetical protein IJ644_03290, partial [Oscillospiraceae bacterium]|nr:hypothetical protein [Oscillospiraceae bacterium]